MSFGWSFGDIVAGFKLVYDIYEAVSDGPRNARVEASQFFNEFEEVISRLDQWEARKSACKQDKKLEASHVDLKQHATVFIKRHISLIQQANPGTTGRRKGRSTWLKVVAFSAGQVTSLYDQVQWPFERKEVSRLREKLQFFLQLSAWDVALDTNSIVRDFRTSHVELLSSNLKLVSSHLDLVSLITLNLKRVTNPLEPGTRPHEIDYPMLRQFDQALRPPQPLQAIDAPRREGGQPWHSEHHNPADYACVSPATSYDHNAGLFDQNEIRGLISRRLDNMSMRVRRVETMESLPEDEPPDETASLSTLLRRLADMRNQIGSAVGISDCQIPPTGVHHLRVEPGSALRNELDAWNQLESRIEREILHPGHVLARGSQYHAPTTAPIPIPPRKQTGSLSPSASNYDGWHGPPHSSPSSCRSHLSPSPTTPGDLTQRRSSSISSASPAPSIRLGHCIRVQISYSSPTNTHTEKALIRSIARFDDGEVQSISSTCQDKPTEIQHRVDLKAPSLTETSMKPFLDNKHVYKHHKWRVQFQGAHNIKVTKPDKTSRYQTPPIYKFYNETDFLEFQSLLLNKEVKFAADVRSIRTNADKDQCRVGTIRVLLDPFSGNRSIFYFRHTPDQKDDFEEWPVSIFKEPTEPKTNKHTITLDSHDGRALATPSPLSRRTTQGSITTIASFESTGPAFSRLENRTSSSRIIKGLVIDFYDYHDCYNFWMAFKMKDEISVFGEGNYGLGVDLPAELPAESRVELPA